MAVGRLRVDQPTAPRGEKKTEKKDAFGTQPSGPQLAASGSKRKRLVLLRDEAFLRIQAALRGGPGDFRGEP